jgi:hypothetical protein
MLGIVTHKMSIFLIQIDTQTRREEGSMRISCRLCKNIGNLEFLGYVKVKHANFKKRDTTRHF